MNLPLVHPRVLLGEGGSGDSHMYEGLVEDCSLLIQFLM